jgi:hypothetical protein|tara:strand:- start:95 stop:292 length:198 start_codon:yes stop_codon:yes gene_type:complete
VYSTRKKILAFKCAKCFTEDSNVKLAWFVGSNSLYSDSLLCNPCFKDQFNKLKETEKGTWAFYDK